MAYLRRTRTALKAGETLFFNRARQQAAASEIARKITAETSLDELARIVLSSSCSSFDCDAALVLSDAGALEATCWASSASVAPEMIIAGLPARLDQTTLVGRAFQAGKTQIEANTAPGEPLPGGGRIDIAVPLHAGGRVVGALQLTGVSLDPTDSSALQALDSFAIQIAAWVAQVGTVAEGIESKVLADSRSPIPNPSLNQVYDTIYRAACELMSCDSLFIVLYDERTQSIEFIFRVEGNKPISYERVPVGEGLINYVIRSRQGVIVADTETETRFEVRRRGGPGRVRSLVCVPMEYSGQVTGALSAQSFRENAYSDADLKILRVLGAQAALAIHNTYLFAESQRKVEQLAALNQVIRIVSSTIEINRLLDLICGEVSRILPAAASYFVALADESTQQLVIQVAVDEGQRLPSVPVSIGDSLSGYVMRNRATLLLRDVENETASLGLSPFPIGAGKTPVSWLGAPLMTQEHMLGVLAVGSYQPAAFDESDREILQSVAYQAAIAIDNARHHAEVERRARQDSLTEALNHGYFLTVLGEELTRAREYGTGLSLIMLDIDHFKEYNDKYGHLAGDTILRATVAAVRSNVKAIDHVGRWGGEEFAVALPGCAKPDALLVAERVRKTLAEIKLTDDTDKPIRVPTVSQGIASFPDDAREVYALVNVADQHLYRAKARGRDQISVAGRE